MNYYDKRGVPICKGDLVRSHHFIGRRNKQYYLYHVAVEENGEMFMVPTAWLEPSLISGGGKVNMRYGLNDTCEVIAGHGPDPFLSFEDRPKVPRTKKPEAL